MPPQLSLIVPCHEQPEALPRFLHSVAAQSLEAVEVIMAGGRAAPRCRACVAAYAEKGVNIRMAEAGGDAPDTHFSRIRAGIEASAAPVVAFADAGGVLWGTDTLAYHVRLLHEQQADLVHFPILALEGAALQPTELAGARPFAPSLEGEAIFARYVAEELRGHALEGKLFSRSLCVESLETMRQAGAGRHGDAFFLLSLCLFHARRYRGSDRAGYAAPVARTAPEVRYSEVVGLSTLLHTFIPFLVRQGCLPETAESCSRVLQRRLFACVEARYAGSADDDAAFASPGEPQGNPHTGQDSGPGMSREDEQALIRAFLAGHPFMCLAVRAREKKARRTALLRRLEKSCKTLQRLCSAWVERGRKTLSAAGLRALFRLRKG